MDYQEFSGEVISEQDKAFAKEFTNFVNGRMCSAEKTGKEAYQSAPLSPAADVQGVHGFHATVGIQLSKRVL